MGNRKADKRKGTKPAPKPEPKVKPVGPIKRRGRPVGTSSKKQKLSQSPSHSRERGQLGTLSKRVPPKPEEENNGKTAIENPKTDEIKEEKPTRKGNQGRPRVEKEDVKGVVKIDDASQKEAEAVIKLEQPKKKESKGEAVPRPVKYEDLGEGPSRVPKTGKMYVGCHVSGANGLWHAFKNANECEAKSFGIFLRNQRQWVSKPLEEETIKKWADAMKDMLPHLILPHGSYLMNLGSPIPETLKKGRNLLLEEVQRCQKLGIPHFNFHPGSTIGKTSREECCKTIAESINMVVEQTQDVILVLENMSCQGFTVGGDFHELRVIIENVKDRTRVGVCLDTCHAHAAGYDLGTEEGFQLMVKDFSQIVGWQFLRGLHINDSKGEAGDHLDRHETIGKGTIGKEGFRRVMNFEHFQDLPMILETPWTSNEGYAEEIKILEDLIKK